MQLQEHVPGQEPGSLELPRQHPRLLPKGTFLFPPPAKSFFFLSSSSSKEIGYTFICIKM